MATLAIVNKNIFVKIAAVILLATITLPIRVVIPKLMNRLEKSTITEAKGIRDGMPFMAQQRQKLKV
ncbi:hypothetical protein QDY69_10690 [Kingella negevensis]|nr:hypothetical protein [Kingella negevensis]MDK4683373.1 hypothetical protein [Kingella negevensis]